MKRVTVCVLAAAAALLWVGAVRAERGSQNTNPGLGPGSPAKPQSVAPSAGRSPMFAAGSVANARPLPQEQRDERRFLKDAAAANRFEVDASRLALAKSNDPRVRSFASALINHHVAAGTELQHMLHNRGMAPPMLGNEQRKTLNRLVKISGSKFDREYIHEVAIRHQQEAVQLYERAGLTARDPVLKAWIDRSVPALQYHLSTAERFAGTPRPKLVKAGSPRAALDGRP